jgi:hypothetical protein
LVVVHLDIAARRGAGGLPAAAGCKKLTN